jgi:hypothetical protein
MLDTLLKKLIRTATGRTRFFMAVIGLSVALLLILAAIQVQVNYNEMLHGKTNQDSIANFIVVNKVVNNGNIGNATLSNDDINKLKQQPFTDAVGIIAPSRFKASLESYTKTFPFSTDIAFESVADDFLDVSSKDWHWDSSSNYIPMVIPNMFLDMYNFEFSVSQGYPQVTQDALKMILFKVNIYDRTKQIHSYSGKIVGFSDRISSVLVPQSFMDEANKNFGDNNDAKPSRVVLRTKDMGNPTFIQYLHNNNLTADADKTRFSKYRQIVEVVVNASWATGAILLLFALLVFTLFIQLTIASCKEEIKLLVTLGASPKQLQRFLVKQFFPSNVVIVVASLLIVALLQYLLHLVLQRQHIVVNMFLSYYTVIVAAAILLTLWIVNRSTIKKYISVE